MTGGLRCEEVAFQEGEISERILVEIIRSVRVTPTLQNTKLHQRSSTEITEIKTE